MCALVNLTQCNILCAFVLLTCIDWWQMNEEISLQIERHERCSVVCVLTKPLKCNTFDALAMQYKVPPINKHSQQLAGSMPHILSIDLRFIYNAVKCLTRFNEIESLANEHV